MSTRTSFKVGRYHCLCTRKSSSAAATVRAQGELYPGELLIFLQVNFWRERTLVTVVIQQCTNSLWQEIKVVKVQINFEHWLSACSITGNSSPERCWALLMRSAAATWRPQHPRASCVPGLRRACQITDIMMCWLWRMLTQDNQCNGEGGSSLMMVLVVSHVAIHLSGHRHLPRWQWRAPHCCWER